MRLHRLSMTAFGPFAGTEVVDFDALTAAGLFLLHGPTGAGKTSVLDAVCFALYGQVPGGRSGGRPRLRSDHAPADREPKVQLEVTLCGRRLEVTRTPEWVRPKKRGTGVMTQPGATHVRELVGDQWQPVTARADEAAQLLLDLLGMGHEQFTKVVLLPQGDFAAFLRADADERRALLGRLFSIDRFTGVEVWLGEERRRLAAQVAAAEQHTVALLARASEAFAGLPDTDDNQPLDDGTAEAELKASRRVGALLERAEWLGRGAQVELEVQTERASAARAGLADATAVAARRSRWSTACARLSALEATTASHAEAVRRIASARRAAPLAGLLDTAAAAAAQAEVAGEAVQRARVCVPPVALDMDEVALRVLVASHRMTLGSLQGATKRLGELTQLRERITAASAQHDQAQVAGAASSAAFVQAVAEVERAQAARQEAALAAADRDAAATAEAAAERVVGLVAELVACERQISGAGTAQTEAVDADQEAREHLIASREQRLAHIAGELAAELREGERCQVCGSRDHPAAASVGTGHVGHDQEQAAAARAEVTRRAREQAAQLCATLLARRAELLARTQGVDLDEARAELTAARERVAAAQLARGRSEHEAEVAVSAGRRRDLAADEQKQWATASAQSATSRAELTGRRDALGAELEDQRGADADVPARVTRLRAELGAMESLLDALATARGADLVAAEQQRRFTAACLDCQFADAAEASDAVLPTAQLEELATVVAEHDRRCGDLRAVLDDPELIGVADLPDPELERLQAEVAQADHDLQRAASAATLALGGVRRLGRLAGEIAEHEDASAPAKERYDRVDDLSACVGGTGGGNALRMRLSAYVLAARLEEVAAAATERLAMMSDGRYGLVHSDERGKGGGRSGLGLRVVDAWTGVERETSTLSGGESFLASLALALGLADVVQAEAGGTTIETLFVDEGFGTLDEQTLEEVMTVLDGLRDGGRAVGLVSHVVDLRTRIPAQLEVRKTRSGSTLALLAG